jgi:hypothetical protein
MPSDQSAQKKKAGVKKSVGKKKKDVAGSQAIHKL